jgi:hypothetical protein
MFGPSSPDKVVVGRFAEHSFDERSFQKQTGKQTYLAQLSAFLADV